MREGRGFLQGCGRGLTGGDGRGEDGRRGREGETERQRGRDGERASSRQKSFKLEGASEAGGSGKGESVCKRARARLQACVRVYV